MIFQGIWTSIDKKVRNPMFVSFSRRGPDPYPSPLDPCMFTHSENSNWYARLYNLIGILVFRLK